MNRILSRDKHFHFLEQHVFIEMFSFHINLIKFLEVNEASLMMRGGGGNSQIYRVPSFGDPFDNDDEVCEKREKWKNNLFFCEKC